MQKQSEQFTATLQQRLKQNFQLPESGITSLSWRDCGWGEENGSTTC